MPLHLTIDIPLIFQRLKLVSLSQRHLAENAQPVSFDPDELGRALQAQCPGISFAFLMGSGADGVVPTESDVDLALYLNEKPDVAFYGKVTDAVKTVVPGVRCDIGVLNQAEPVYCFEALKGRRLFARDPEQYQEFFSRTSRDYEERIRHYETQHAYRLEAAHAG